MKRFYPLIIVLLLGGFVTAKVTQPRVQEAAAARDEQQTRVDDLQGVVAQLPVEQARQKTLMQAMEDVKKNLPDDEALPEVLGTIGEAASRLGVQTGRLTRSVRASSIPGVTAVDFDLAITGSYARVQALVQTVARLPRAYTARGISLTGNDQHPGEVSGNLQLTTYKRDANPAATSTSTPGTPAAGGTP